MSTTLSDIQCAENAIEVLEQYEFADSAAAMHALAAEILQSHEFVVEFEHTIFYIDTLKQKRRGRIDLVAYKYGGAVAIELDCRNPRTKSIQKLRAFDGAKIFALRGIRVIDMPAGIDGAAYLQCRQATRHEKKDKRTVNRSLKFIPDWKAHESMV